MKRVSRLKSLLPSPGRWRRPDRLQVGALPWRQRPDGSIEVLLITSRGTGQWIIPKGGLMDGLTLPEAAAEEAWEEAGVRGRIEQEEAGSFMHMKSRPVGRPVCCRVAVFPLAVEREYRQWPERVSRQRRWMPIETAMVAVRSRELRAIIAELPQRSGDSDASPAPAPA